MEYVGASLRARKEGNIMEYIETEKSIAFHPITIASGIAAYEVNEDYIRCAYVRVRQSDYAQVRSRICKCRIEYARPEWSEYAEPYIRTHGMRVYLSQLMRADY